MATDLAPSPAISASESLFEVIDGLVVEKAVGTPESLTASDLQGWLFLFLHRNPIGKSVVEMLFEMNPRTGRQRRPDLAFISAERLAVIGTLEQTPLRVAPDLVVEVVSEHDAYHEVLGKVDEYFEAGVKVVWLVSNRLRRIQVYRSSLDSTILAAGDVLDGGSVLPGFRLPLGDLFGTGGGADSKTG